MHSNSANNVYQNGGVYQNSGNHQNGYQTGYDVNQHSANTFSNQNVNHNVREPLLGEAKS